MNMSLTVALSLSLAIVIASLGAMWIDNAQEIN